MASPIWQSFALYNLTHSGGATWMAITQFVFLADGKLSGSCRTPFLHGIIWHRGGGGILPGVSVSFQGGPWRCWLWLCCHISWGSYWGWDMWQGWLLLPAQNQVLPHLLVALHSEPFGAHSGMQMPCWALAIFFHRSSSLVISWSSHSCRSANLHSSSGLCFTVWTSATIYPARSNSSSSVCSNYLSCSVCTPSFNHKMELARQDISLLGL